MLKLYCAPSTISTAVVAFLNEGADWEPIRVDVRGGEQTRPDYLKINPKGRVPVLVTPEGLVTETGAILDYIAETALPAFMPTDAFGKARVREVMFYLASTMHVNHAHLRRASRWADDPAAQEAMAAKVPETMRASAAYLEGVIEGPYLFGERPTIADFYLYTPVYWLAGDKVEVADFPKLAAFKAVMEERESVKKAWADGFYV